MSATNIFDLEVEWQNAPNGFGDGADFKTWLAGEVILLRASVAALKAERDEQARRLDKMNLEDICERIHAEWMNYNRANGAESRCAIWGEELMKPWNDLSERAKDLDRCTIRSVLDALNAPAPHAEQCTCGMSEATEPEYHAKDCAYYVDPSPIVEIPGIDYPAPQYVSR